MRAWHWVLVAVLAVGLIGCEQKRKDEELPQINPAELEASAPPPEPVPAKPTESTEPVPAVEVETPAPSTTTPPAAPASPTTPASAQPPRTYVMQRGDTLYSLAKRFYGDGKLWTKIADANRDKVRDVTAIPVGTVLVIPPK